MTILNEAHLEFGNWKVPKDFKPGKEVLIAFSKKNGHAYLVAGKYEVHGHFIFKKTFSRPFCEKSCEPILYIRFKDLSEKDILKVEDYIKNTESIRESSCINYCLITLYSSLGILIDSKGNNIIGLEDCLVAALNNGATRDNRNLSIEIIKTTDDNLNSIIEHFNNLEKRFKWTHIISRLLGKLLFFSRPTHRSYYKALYQKNLPYTSSLA
jgi:hypothetical protein